LPMASTSAVATAPPPEGVVIPPTDPRSRWPRRVLIALNVVVAACLVGAGLVYGYVTYRNDQIHRIGVGGLAGGASAGPMTILVVGSDTRSDLKTAQDRKTFGGTQDAGGQRSDTIMLLHLDPGSHTASLLSIPRDLFVQIPGTNRRDRINSTFDKGPDLLVRTITEDLGIPIDHYMEVDFVSFRGIVNSIGAVHVYFPTPARDVYSGLNITTPGCYGLSGEMALQYVRARHFQYYENGRWHFEGESDLARIRRQQDFIRKLASKAVAAGLTDAGKLNGVIGALAPRLTVDKGFGLPTMVSLARAFRKFNPSALQSSTLPTTGTVIGGADVLLIHQPDAQSSISTFLNPAPPTAAAAPASPATLTPASIRVRVLNGTGVAGRAASGAATLGQLGFQVTGTGNADSARYITSVIRFGPGADAQAQYLQPLIIGAAQTLADPSLAPGEVALIIGGSYSGVRNPPAPGAPAASAGPSTTTTVPALPGTPANGQLPPCPA